MSHACGRLSAGLLAGMTLLGREMLLLKTETLNWDEQAALGPGGSFRHARLLRSGGSGHAVQTQADVAKDWTSLAENSALGILNMAGARTAVWRLAALPGCSRTTGRGARRVRAGIRGAVSGGRWRSSTSVFVSPDDGRFGLPKTGQRCRVMHQDMAGARVPSFCRASEEASSLRRPKCRGRSC